MPYRKKICVLTTAWLVFSPSYGSSQEITSSYPGSDPSQPEFNVLGFGDISYISEEGNDEDGFVIG